MRGGRNLSFAALLLLSACGSEVVEEPLDDLRGRWITNDDAQYVERAFEIENDFLYIRMGGDTFSVHKIRGVDVSQEDLPEYTLEYRGDEGALFSFRVQLSQEAGGTLFFPNQMEMRWRRDPGAYVPWGALLDVERAAQLATQSAEQPPT
jgi:hypothetical protein